jgi:DNA-directed RNA polymerase II subunit RPB1
MPEGMVVDATGMVEQKLGAEYVLAWFKRISDEDAAVMSFNPDWCMPKDLIVETVLVVPPACRPSVRQYNGQRSEDDITHSYISIIKHNNSLKEALASSQSVSEDQIRFATQVVLHHVMTLHDNDGKKLPQAQTRTYRPIKSFIDRLKGKEGRIRSNLMGKRVDFSARSVISPDANIKMSELGVPLEIAMNLTYPEIVNKYNINGMYKLVRNGNKVYPGAKSIEAGKTKRTTMLMDSNLDDIILEYGDTVHRHLQDGDYVLFNRQPTLHRMSMMAHKVKVMPGKTFRFNTDICECYNADFDGDLNRKLCF